MSNPEYMRRPEPERLAPALTPEQQEKQEERLKLSALSEPLFHAAKMGDREQIQKLAAAGADVNVADRFGKMTFATPLHYAASEGHLSAMQALLALGADPNARDYRERSPLHEAALRGQVGAIRALVAKGADLNAAAFGGDTPLRLAKMAQKPDAARLIEELLAAEKT